MEHRFRPAFQDASVSGLGTLKYTNQVAGSLAHPTALQVARHRSRNSAPRMGIGLGKSHRVSPRRNPRGRCEANLEFNFKRSFIPSFAGSPDANGVRNDVLRPGRSAAIRGVAGSGRCSRPSPQGGRLGNLAGSLRASFPRSSRGSLHRSYEVRVTCTGWQIAQQNRRAGSPAPFTLPNHTDQQQYSWSWHPQQSQ